jgi:phosphocarrier protein
VIEREVVILNSRGLHARAAARFVQVASAFRSRIQVRRDGQAADGKSILGLLALLARAGARLTIRVEGADERDAIEALATLVAGGFDEGS